MSPFGLFGGGDGDDEPESDTTEKQGEEAPEPRQEDPVDEEPQENYETLDVGEYEVEVENPTETDRKIKGVDDPVEYLLELNEQVRNQVVGNLSDELTQEILPDVEEIRKMRKGAEMTVRTPSFWKKRPDAPEVMEEVAEEAGMETEELYEDLESEEARKILGSFVKNVFQPYRSEEIEAEIDDEVNKVEPDDVQELYEVAATFADFTGSSEEFVEVLEEEFGQALDEKYGESERKGANKLDTNLDTDDLNKVRALYHSLYSSERDIDGALPDDFDFTDVTGVNVNVKTQGGQGLSDLSKARFLETYGGDGVKEAEKAVERAYNEDLERRQAALIAETFDILGAYLSTEDGTKRFEDVARKYVKDAVNSGDNEEAVGLASQIKRPDLLEETIDESKVEDMSGEEALSVVSAGYQSDEVVDQAIDYAERRILDGDTGAYETLEELTDREVEEDLSPEAEVALTAL